MKTANLIFAGSERFAARKDLPLLLLLLSFAALLYTFRIDPDIGTDEYLMLSLYARTGTWSLLPPEFSTAGVLGWMLKSAKLIYSDYHGLFPACLFGLFYKIWDGLGLTVTKQTLLIPHLLLSLAVVSMFYLLILKIGFARLLAASGALLLVLSPLFTMYSRTGTGPHLLTVLFNQLLLLHVLLRFENRRKSMILLGLAVSYVILSELSFIFSVPLVFTAFLLFSIKNDIPGGLAVRERIIRRITLARWQLKPFLHWQVWLAPLICGAVVIFYLVNWQPHRLLDNGRGAFSQSLLLQGISDFGIYFLWQYSELLAPLLVAAIISYLIGKIYKLDALANMNWVFNYSILALVGFGIVCTVFNRHYWANFLGYQIVLLIPMLIFILSQIRVLLSHRLPITKFLGGSLLILFILSTGAANAGLIWKFNNLQIGEYAGYDIDTLGLSFFMNGRRGENDGTRAGGYLIRELIVDQFEYPATKLHIYANLPPQFRSKWHYQNWSLAIYGGITDELMVQRGIAGDVTVTRVGNKDKAVVLPLQDNLPKAPYYCVMEFSSDGIAVPDSKFFRYGLVNEENQLLIEIYTNRCSPNFRKRLPQGMYRISDLDIKFLAKYNRMDNYFAWP